MIPDSAVDHGPFRHSRVLEAGIQEVRNAWMPASAGMTPFSLRQQTGPVFAILTIADQSQHARTRGVVVEPPHPRQGQPAGISETQHLPH